MGPYWTAAAAAALLCLAALVLAPTGSAAVPSTSLQSRSDDDDTQLALDEVGRLFRRMFPLVPDKAQYFWRSSLLGGTLVLRNHEQRPRSGSAETTAEDKTETRLMEDNPWRADVQFRKRGPDCMRKCIAQGVLHPVQCHSLC